MAAKKTSMHAAAQVVWLSPAEVGERLGISERLVRTYVERGDLAAKRLGPRLLRISAADADALLTDADS